MHAEVQIEMAEETSFDLIIVGAGLSGLVAAARYLQAHSESRLAILEQDHCLGGVWSERRNYPTFWTQWAYGIAEFSDMAMTRPPAEDCLNDLFKAKYTTIYLEEYADYLKFAGRSLRDRIQFRTRVQTITKADDRWHLQCTAPLVAPTHLETKRLMIANGLAAAPRFPELPGKEEFQGTILHSGDFGENNIMSDNKVRHVTVMGGGKSAADMVYEAVTAGKTVSWIIRKTGDGSNGPGFFAPADAPTPYRNAGEMAQTRVMSSLQPCFMIKDSWWMWLLHQTSFGIRLVRAVFDKADDMLQKRARYKERMSTRGFEKLQYETSLFWQNGVGGVLHHADFYDLVAANVDVYRGRVRKLTDNQLYLDDDISTHFPCDAILCGTGWENDFSMFNTKLQLELGLPHNKEMESSQAKEKWDKLCQAADETVLARFPILKRPPPHVHLANEQTPYRLFRANKMFGAEAQAMWAVAHFDGNTVYHLVEERERDIAMWLAWCRRRYLSNGELANYAAFDGVPFVDTLLDDMGLVMHRRKGFLQNFFAPFMPADLGKAWKEYLDRRKCR